MIRPIGDRAILELIERANSTKSGIVIATVERKELNLGKILSIGTGKQIKKLAIKIGDIVAFNRYKTEDALNGLDGEEYVKIVDYDNILAVLT